MSTAAAKERPILFSSATVRAIFEGRKNQHRTVVRLLPSWTARGLTHGDLVESGWWESPEGWQYGDEIVPCPYGKPGDRLWVRETWIPVAFGSYEPICGAAPRDACQIEYAAAAHSGYHTPWDHYAGKWRPSIHMPPWASRLTLEIVKVKVERLQEISEEDAKAEGVEYHIGVERWRTYSLKGQTPFCSPTAKDSFFSLWDSINAKRDGGKSAWSANPWVWAIEFKRAQP